MSRIPHPQSRFHHLLLDLDGTLIYSGNFLLQLEFISRILPLMKKHSGWRAAWRAMKESREVLKTPSTTETNHERMIAIFQKHLGLNRENAEQALLEALLMVFPRLEPHFGEIKGAKDFISWAKKLYTLTLTTNPVWPIQLVQMRMRWGGIDPDDFSSITTSDRMHACKPWPEYYQETLLQENFRAEDCLLIGNERKMDLPATKVGIAVFLIRPSSKRITCVMEPGPNSPGAWRGNYEHLKQFLEEHVNHFKEKEI